MELVLVTETLLCSPQLENIYFLCFVSSVLFWAKFTAIGGWRKQVYNWRPEDTELKGKRQLPGASSSILRATLLPEAEWTEDAVTLSCGNWSAKLWRVVWALQLHPPWGPTLPLAPPLFLSSAQTTYSSEPEAARAILTFLAMGQERE